MLLKPVVPLTPVTVKETVVVVADWFVVIAMLVICELVMFPLIPRSTFAPLDVVAVTYSVGVGVGVVLGLGVAVRVDVEGGGVGVEVEFGEFTVIETALEVNVIGTEALSATLQVIECEDPQQYKNKLHYQCQPQ